MSSSYSSFCIDPEVVLWSLESSDYILKDKFPYHKISTGILRREANHWIGTNRQSWRRLRHYRAGAPWWGNLREACTATIQAILVLLDKQKTSVPRAVILISFTSKQFTFSLRICMFIIDLFVASLLKVKPEQNASILYMTTKNRLQPVHLFVNCTMRKVHTWGWWGGERKDEARLNSWNLKFFPLGSYISNTNAPNAVLINQRLLKRQDEAIKSEEAFLKIFQLPAEIRKCGGTGK